MGTMSHDALLVTGSTEHVIEAHAAALEAAREVTAMPGFDTDWTQVISPVVLGVMNGYATFMVAPDGSKEWWGHSDKGDEMRKRIVDAVERVTVVKVRWGELGDEIEVESKWRV